MQSNQQPKHLITTEDKTEEVISQGTLKAYDVLTIIVARRIGPVTTATNQDILPEIVEHHEKTHEELVLIPEMLTI